MGVCAESLRRSLAESFSQFGAQVRDIYRSTLIYPNKVYGTRLNVLR